MRACSSLFRASTLRATAAGREVVHALEGDVDVQVALAGQGVGHLEGDPRLHRLQAVVEVVDVDLQELAVGHRRQRLGGLAGQVRHHAHHEGQLDLLLGAVELDVVLDLDPRRPVAGDELLAALFGHRGSPLRSLKGNGGPPLAGGLAPGRSSIGPPVDLSSTGVHGRS